MTLGTLFRKGSKRTEFLAALGYIAVITGMVSAVGWIGSSIVLDYDSVAALQDRLALLQARREPPALDTSDQETESGSPFIRGTTITQAGADLQERIGRAVLRVGGSLLSSQVELDGSQSKAGAISLIADVEISQPELQNLLYDIEAGMPYLFIDSLSAQPSQAVGEHDGSRMQVSLGVSGQWEEKP